MTTPDLAPVFIFSLPRSGSTLLQRILAAHDSITTTSEPWILLPFIYALRDRGIYTEYRQTAAMAAIQDFIGAMPRGTIDYQEELKNFITRLYVKNADEAATYFVDKTPRYHLIIDDIINIFPNGKFIFIWRNPLAIVSSLIESFSNGRWELYRFQVDLFNGLENLNSASEKYKNMSYFLNYENLLTYPELYVNQVFDYLDLAAGSEVISSFTKVQLHGRKGDPTGINLYDNISTEPLDKWKKSFANPFRKLWCQNYLKWIGEDRLRNMGYKKINLLDELNSIPLSSNFLVSDFYHWLFGFGYRFLEPRIAKHKLQYIPKWYHIHAHT